MYFKKYQMGDQKARERIILHNIKLVFYEVERKFKNTGYERMDLIQIGMIGLIKGIDHYDLPKKIKFSTFAVRCIDNEIAMFLRKGKKIAKDDSLETIISFTSDGDELKLVDILFEENLDVVQMLSNQMIYEMIIKIVKQLPSPEKEIVKMYLGIDVEPISRCDIAQKFGMSYLQVSRIIRRQKEFIKQKLFEHGFIEMEHCQKIKRNKKRR